MSAWVGDIVIDGRYALTSEGDNWEITLGFSSPSECQLYNMPSSSWKILTRKSYIDCDNSADFLSSCLTSRSILMQKVTLCVPSLSGIVEFGTKADCLASREDAVVLDETDEVSGFFGF